MNITFGLSSVGSGGATSSSSVSSANAGAPLTSASVKPRTVPVVLRITLFILLASEIDQYGGHLISFNVTKHGYGLIIAVLDD